MKVNLLDLSRQYLVVKDEVEPAINELMASGMYIMGQVVEEFENQLAEYLGVKYAVAVNSGTDALIIALKAIGIKAGDEVITTPFTFFATAEAIASVGAIPVFVDVEEITYNIDISKIEEKITKKTKAILPVHIFGHPVKMKELCEIAEKYNLKVIEDCCQAIGAEYNDVKVGGLGDIGCFSFFPTKNLGAFGDGGIITTQDEKMAIICRALREHGMAQNGAKARYYLEGTQDDLQGVSSMEGLYNPYKYYNYLIGGNSRLDAMQAKILSIKLKYLDEFNHKRRCIAEFYDKEMSNCKSIILPQFDNNVIPVWHQYAVRCARKDQLGNFLAQHQIASGAFYPIPLHLQKAFIYLGYKKGDLPIAEKLAKETVCLPIFPELQKEELEYVVWKIKEFARGNDNE